MDDAKKFLRYVMPGSVCLGLTLLFIALTIPGFIPALMTLLSDNADVIGLLLGTFLASGALGYVLASMYFAIRWLHPGLSRYIAPDHRLLIRTAVAHSWLELHAVSTSATSSAMRLTVDQAWMLSQRRCWEITTASWFMNVADVEDRKHLVTYDGSLVDHKNSLAATFMGAVLSVVMLYGIVVYRAIRGYQPSDTYALCVPLAVGALWLSYRSFHSVLKSHDKLSFSWAIGLLRDASAPWASTPVVLIEPDGYSPRKRRRKSFRVLRCCLNLRFRVRRCIRAWRCVVKTALWVLLFVLSFYILMHGNRQPNSILQRDVKCCCCMQCGRSSETTTTTTANITDVGTTNQPAYRRERR